MFFNMLDVSKTSVALHLTCLIMQFQFWVQYMIVGAVWKPSTVISSADPQENLVDDDPIDVAANRIAINCCQFNKLGSGTI